MRIAALVLSMIAMSLFAHAAFARTPAHGDTMVPPPKPVYEVDMGERTGYTLSPGYWRWNGSSHVWNPSRWIANREGYIWVQDQWQQRGDVWHLSPGHWIEDETYEEQLTEASDAEPVASPPKAASKKKAAKKRVKKLNYADPVLWPRPTRR